MSLTGIEWTGTPARERIVLSKALRLDGKVFLEAGTHDVGAILPGFTFNPWLGCEKVSPACKHCYAEAWAKLRGYTADGHRRLQIWGPAPTTPRVRTSKAYWKRPLAWNKLARQLGTRLKVFCASLADVGEDHPLVEPWRRDLFPLIDATPELDWLLLTKRSAVLRDRWPWKWSNRPRNVWVGSTMENQACAEERIVDLVEIPAAHHFASVEPMIGRVDLDPPTCPRCGGNDSVVGSDGATLFCAPCGPSDGNGEEMSFGAWLDPCENERQHGLSWVIIGGESGGGHAELDLVAAEELADQCLDAGVAVFVKQDSGPQPGMRGRLSDRMWALKQWPVAA